MSEAQDKEDYSDLSTRYWLLGAPYAPPARWQRIGHILLCLTMVVFGVVVEIRSAFLKRHMTDLGVYLRAAWAVRVGEDPYTVTDDNGWHYHYPTLFAILMVPFADPPAGADRTGMLPFWLIVALWYAFSLVCAAFAVHMLAGALEQTSPDPAVRGQPRGCRRWWALRLLPMLACLVPIGHTLARGQVNLLLLLLLSGMAAALLRGRSWQAGFWLAGAICLKIIPALLLIYPVWRRDRRCLAGCALGLVVGLALIPSLVFGPVRNWAYFREWDQALRQPALQGEGDQSRAKELIDVTATDSQSFLAILHNTTNLDRYTRPTTPAPWVRVAHWLIGGLLLGIMFLLAGRGRLSASKETIFLGGLVLMMMLLSPVCHLHYFCLLLPLVMGLMAATWEQQSSVPVRCGFWILLGVNAVASALPHLPGLEILRDVGLVTYTALTLWLAGVVWVARRSPVKVSNKAGQSTIMGAAA
jgi:alpha-1,2-mannosyltransferase